MGDASRSVALNSYGTQKPRGPNFLRSWTIECMKHGAYSIGRHSSRFTASSQSCEMKVLYDLRSPAFMPEGGSSVILIAICSRPIGNLGCGSEVIHRRKLGSTSSMALMYPSSVR